MKVVITGRKVTIRPSFTERAEKKFKRLDKFFGEDAVCLITVSQLNREQRVEATVRYNGMIYRAEATEPDAMDALDKLDDILVRQLRKHKTKLERRLRQSAFEPVQGEEEIAEEGLYDVIRRKSIPVGPMDVEEAILQMNMLGHQFYMFENTETHEINVVYRRADGDYGLIEPER